MANVFDRLDRIESGQTGKKDVLNRLDRIQPVQSDAERYVPSRKNKIGLSGDRYGSSIGRGFAGEKTTLGQRVTDTVKGGVKGSGAAYTNLVGTLYDAAKEMRKTGEQQDLEKAKTGLENAQLTLAQMEQASPGTYTEEQLKKQRKAVEDYRAEYDLWSRVSEETEQGNVKQGIYNAADRMAASGAQDIGLAKAGLGKTGQILVDAGASMTQTALDSLMSAATGTGMLSFGARAFGGGTQQARQDNPESTLGQQIGYGAASAAKEVFTEKLFNIALPFAKAYGGGTADGMVEQAIRKAVDDFATTTLGKKALGGALTFGAGTVSEGLEELIGDWMEWQMPRIYGGDVATAQETLESSLYDFLVGATSGAMGGVISPSTYNYRLTDAETGQGTTKATEPGENQAESGVSAEGVSADTQNEEGLKRAANGQNGDLAKTGAEEILRQAAMEMQEKGSVSSRTADRIMGDAAAMEELGVENTGSKSEQRRAVKSAAESYARRDTQDILRQAAMEMQEEQAQPAAGQENAREQLRAAAGGMEESTQPAVESGQGVQQRLERVSRAAAALGENGAKALTAAYTADTARNVEPAQAVEGFYYAYNSALNGETLTGAAAEKANTLPAHMRLAAENAGQRDAVRAGQAKFFGEKAGLVEDEAYQKANLSSKTRDTLDALGKALGVQVQFAETVADGQANAQYGDGVITLALDAKDPVLTSTVHEAVHRIRETAPEAYNTLAEFVQQTMTAEALDFNLEQRAQLYGTDNTSALTEEMVADAFGRMLGNEDAVSSFVQEHRNVAQKVMDALRDIVNAVKRVLNHQNLKLTPEQKAAFQDLEGQVDTMEKLFENALKKAGSKGTEKLGENKNTAQAGGETRFSLNPDFSSKFDTWLRSGKKNEPASGRFLVGTTSSALQSIGVSDYKIYWNAGKLIKIMNEHPAMTSEVIKSVPNVLEHPILVMQSQTVANRVTMFGEVFDQDGKPVLAALELSPQNKSGEIQDFAIIASAYGKDGAQRLINQSDILYVDPNKKRTDNWLQLLRLQLPSRVTNYGSIHSVTLVERDVNGNISFGETEGKTAMQMAYENALEKKKEAKFSLKSPVEETENLVALHNLTSDKLEKVLKLGGLPMPSIAVTKSDIQHSNFGDITLVMDKSAVDPKANKKNTVYSADAWTPTFPQIEYEADQKATSRVYKQLNALYQQVDEYFRPDVGRSMTQLESQMNDYGGESGVVEKALSNYGLKAAYLEQQGQHVEPVTKQQETAKPVPPETEAKYVDMMVLLDVATPEEAGKLVPAAVKAQYGAQLEEIWPGITKTNIRLNAKLRGLRQWLAGQGEGSEYQTVTDTAATKQAIDSAINTEEYEAWVREMYRGIEKSSGAYNGKERYTELGNQKSFKQTHYPADLEGIVKAMSSQNGGNIKNIAGFHGVKTLRAGMAERFKSVADMHRLEGRLQGLTQEQFDEIHENLSDRLYDVIRGIDEKRSGGNDNSLFRYDTIGEILMEIAEGGTYTIDRIVNTFNGKHGYHIGNELATQVRDLLFDVSQMPVNLFEAKPARAVGFDEVLAAVIPSDSSEKLRSALAGSGVNVLTYESGNEADRLAKVNSVEGARFSRSDRELLADYVKEYGAIPKGEKPSREITMPKKTGDGKKLSQTVRTILEAGVTPDEMIPSIEKLAAQGAFSYDTYTDKQAIADAREKIAGKDGIGWDAAQRKWFKDMEKGNVSKENTAMGWTLYNNAANSGNTTLALDILNQMVEHQRSAAQALQATRILKSMSPETQLYQVQRSVNNLQRELNQRYGDKKGPKLKIDQELAEQFMQAKDQTARDEALKDIYRDIGRQMPTRFTDRWNAWRYMAMLGNTRTHVRNILGNAGFAPVVGVKDLAATAIEAAVGRLSGGKLERSKALVGTGKNGRALLKAAWSDYAQVQETAMSGGKYSDLANANKYVEEGRKIFGNTRSKAWNQTVGKGLETFRKSNGAALDAEDVWFSKPHYAYALAQYCKANNIPAEQIATGKGLEKAREYAVSEAQKATYRDTNYLSQTISELGRVSKNETNPVKKGVGLAMEGILPFRKTPANILARGLEYSPLGLMQGLKWAAVNVRKGKVTGAQAIDRISAGLTGTGLLALGLYAASQGFVRGHGGDDEDKKEFEDLTGHQTYALEAGGTSVTLDWLAPECLPFFIGVNLWEETAKEDEPLTLSAMLDATTTVTEPLLEMSCLQSLNDIFDSVGYAYSDGLDGLPAALASAATSYLTQALPTVGGQLERIGEDKRYTTYTEKNGFLTGDMQYTLGKASGKIPGLDYQQIPYIDAWGRTESTGSAVERVFNNMINPSYTSKIESSKAEEELLRVYNATGEAGVFPERAKKYITVDGERKDLTGEEYVKYATKKGQKSLELVQALTSSTAYKSMSDADKADAIKDAYTLADQVAKSEFGKVNMTSWVEKALDARKRYGIKEETYIDLKLRTGDIESLKDSSGETIANSKSLLIMEQVYNTAGLTDKQRQAMFKYLGVGKSVRHYNKALVQEKLKEMKKQKK